MGLSNLVYPGANHTRFHHALGCLHLMIKTVSVLRIKGVVISTSEENALYIAILLHDIGHGPFSHALEYSIVNGITHEEISLKYMKLLNQKFDGQLALAIEIFTGNYHRSFLHQLISSQLDIDRLDYLKRDSFFTGVVEGNISSERLIAMMNVIDDELVIEKKGIFSVENFLIARRFMYWQVYLHKTGLVAENILMKILTRAKELAKNVDVLFVITPGGNSTKHLVDESVLKALGKSGTLINVSRGSVVDETALIKALQTGTLGFAGLDVFEAEPIVPNELKSMENVVLTPHIGSATIQTRQAMGDLTCDNLLSYFNSGKVFTPVPECSKLNV